MAEKVTYHLPDGRAPLELTVLKKNADGSLELAGADGELKVGKCPVAEVPTVGHCTLGVAPAEEAAPAAPGAPAGEAGNEPEADTAENLLKPKSKKK